MKVTGMTLAVYRLSQCCKKETLGVSGEHKAVATEPSDFIQLASMSQGESRFCMSRSLHEPSTVHSGGGFVFGCQRGGGYSSKPPTIPGKNQRHPHGTKVGPDPQIATDFQG